MHRFLARYIKQCVILFSLLMAFIQTANVIANQDSIKDVCIVGAGASGMYSAFKLKQRGYSVAVLEKAPRVGGNTNTYYRKGNKYQPLGERYLTNKPFVEELSRQLEIPMQALPEKTLNTIYVDFSRGLVMENSKPSWSEWWSPGGNYKSSLARFESLFSLGVNLPEALLEDLLLNTGDYLENNGLDVSFAIPLHHLNGFGNIEQLPALYLLSNLSVAEIESINSKKCLVPEGGMDAIYKKIKNHLGEENFHTNTSLKKSNRIQLSRNGGIGSRIDIEAIKIDKKVNFSCKKLVVSIPPILSNLKWLALDEVERDLFAQFQSHDYWTVILKIFWLGADEELVNLNMVSGVNAVKIPGIYKVQPTQFKNEFSITFGATNGMSRGSVEKQIRHDIESLNFGEERTSMTVVHHERSVNHSPYGLTVSTEAIRNGFYSHLNHLQGRNSTYYVGAAIAGSHNTVDVWEHADSVINRYFPVRSHSD
ncbi:hypothetical protein EOPP23_06935 [Endozoicomonas sp. OPT23]|uniref:FAD-dependent oxidoreductase n=1 Tax=Endozoicomonas sp. OPT23 TaxID=2072845 RepID=UPI00129C0D16|nr:NAD(P)/FAD-dependent oxidoreductase [Endozoicomonas sp. OPT23]MRI32721.1 hypothetical protein [Endozoicomonas sp. OPT23]